MTCVVAVARGPSVWMGADSCVSSGDSYLATICPKIWRAGGYALGAAGGGAWFTLLRQVAWPSEASEGWMLRGLPLALVAAAGRLGLTLPTKADDPHDGSALVCGCVGGAGRIWYVDSTLDVDEYVGPMAVGSGGEAARAALRALGPNAAPARAIRRALEASAAVVMNVGPPFTFLRLDPPKPPPKA